MVWPPADATSVYCIALPKPQLKGMRHRVFETIEKAADFVESVKTVENVFFATHVLRQSRVWNTRCYRNKDTKEWVADWSVRTQKNMRYGIDFFLDLDVKVGDQTKYQNQEEALLALKAFVKATNLPRPMIVNSGGGLHIHWVIDKPLTSNSEWATHAARLRQLATHYGIKFDPMRTTDTASVLRVAGTFNLKNDLQRAVEDLSAPEIVSPETWSLRLTKALDNVDVVPTAEKIEIEVADNDDLGFGSNVGAKERTVANPPQAETMFQVCAQLRRIRDLNGDLREPEWYGAMGAVQFAMGGREACHALSKGHPLYTPAYVDDKIDQWKWGPIKCFKLNLECGPVNNHLCTTCPHVAKDMGPLGIARLLEKAPAPVIEELVDGVETSRELPDPPTPYKRATNGQIEILVENAKSGKTYAEVIHPYDLFPIERTADAAAETETQVWRAKLPHGVTKDFAITASEFVDSRALAARLANNGVYSTRFDELRTYMSAYVQELQRRHLTSVEHNFFGWTKDKTEFVLPHGVVKSDGSLHPVNLGTINQLAKEFAGKAGTMQRQIELLRFYDNPVYVGQQLMVLCGLASTLFFPTGHYGTVVNGCGDSGRSKSSALAAAASMWGNPEDYVINGTKAGATHMAGATTAFALSTLPYVIDELTRMDHEKVKDLVFEFSQKQPRKRSDQKGALRKPQESNKSNIMISSSNVSLQSLIAINNNAGQAGAVRVFEIMLDVPEVHHKFEADEFLRELKKNYGHLGEYFIRKIMPHREAIERRIIAVMKDIEITAKMRADERFWSAVFAAALVTLEITRRLGILNYDYNFLKNWLITVQLSTMRGVVKDEAQAIAPLTVLTNYMEEKDHCILRLNATTEHQLVIPHGSLLGHYDVNGNELVLLKQGFREYCHKANLSHSAILRTLVASGVVTHFDRQFTLGIGTDHAKGRATCFVVKMDHPSIVKPIVAVAIPPNVKPKVVGSNIVNFPQPQGATKP